MSGPWIHRGLVLDPVQKVGGRTAFACVGVHGCGCLVLDVEQHAEWHLRHAGLLSPPGRLEVRRVGEPT